MKTRLGPLVYRKNPDRAVLPVPASSGLEAFISLHQSGHMSFPLRGELPDRERYFESLGLSQERIFALVQTHSRIVVNVTADDPHEYAEIKADGLVTSLPGAILSVTVADCLPILVWSDASPVFCLLHSGWKGTGIVRDAVGMLESLYSTGPGDIHACIGPGIGACCYAVPEERYEQFRNVFGVGCVKRRDNEFFLDLKAANIRLLDEAGAASCDVVTDCTCCGPFPPGLKLGSYRRDGKDGFHNMVVTAGRNFRD